jgi:LysR family glycine cleavage system transcriptional activator
MAVQQVPSTRTLRAFESAVRHRSYSRAAEELGLTHGAISQRIRELEERYGALLFERAGRAMVPTQSALVLVNQVRSALEMLERAFATRTRNSQTLRLSVLPSLAIWLLPRLGDFRARYPEVDVELDSTTRLVGADDDVDVAIRYGPGNWPGVSAWRLCPGYLSAVCSPAYRGEHGILDPADLRGEMLIRNHWQPWTPWLRTAGLTDLEPAGPVYLDGVLVMQAAILGHGVGLCRELPSFDALASGQLLRLFELQVEDVYAWYVVNFRPANANAQSFETWLASQVLPTSEPSHEQMGSGPL